MQCIDSRTQTRQRQLCLDGESSSVVTEQPGNSAAASGVRHSVAFACALTAALLIAAPLPETMIESHIAEAMYLDGPPPAHTGGFGDDTCHACHFENDLDAPGGSLRLGGVPDTFDPSVTYRISVSLERPEMGRAGFQLAARVSGGGGASEPAGALQTLDGDERVQVVVGSDGMSYAQHTEPGTTLTGPETTSWAIEWRPPADGTGSVTFHAAANAANDDASEFGDFIYTASATTARADP